MGHARGRGCRARRVFQADGQAGDPCESGRRWCPSPLHCSASGICITSDDAASGSGTAFNYAFVTSTAIATPVMPADADAFCQMKATTLRAGVHRMVLAARSALSRLGTPNSGGSPGRPAVRARRGASCRRPDRPSAASRRDRRREQRHRDHADRCRRQSVRPSVHRPRGQGRDRLVRWSDEGVDCRQRQKCNLPARVYCLATDGIAPAPLPEPAVSRIPIERRRWATPASRASTPVPNQATQAQLANATTFVAPSRRRRRQRTRA